MFTTLALFATPVAILVHSSKKLGKMSWGWAILSFVGSMMALGQQPRSMLPSDAAGDIGTAFAIFVLWFGVYLIGARKKLRQHPQTKSTSPTSHQKISNKPMLGNRVEVPDKWQVSDGRPFIVEQNPDLEKIFTGPNPEPPHQTGSRYYESWKKESNTQIRGVLAVAYLTHPDPHIRLKTIRYAQDLKFWGIRQMLVDLLADPANEVRGAAAEAIWERAKSVYPESMAFSLRALRDEIRGFGDVSYTSQINSKQALAALETLRNARPGQKNEFNKWIVDAWCRDYPEYGHKLIDVWAQYGTFKNGAYEATKQIGRDLKKEFLGATRMNDIINSIETALGKPVADKLASIWDKV